MLGCRQVASCSKPVFFLFIVYLDIAFRKSLVTLDTKTRYKKNNTKQNKNKTKQNKNKNKTRYTDRFWTGSNGPHL